MTKITVPKGTLTGGSLRGWPEEQPVQRTKIKSFMIESTPVTQDQFAAFIKDTGYVTTAESTPGSLMFKPTPCPVPLKGKDVMRQWWRFSPHATWRLGRGDHPVTHVTKIDADAYCDWVGGRLPTEREWEWAARGGTITEFIWGDHFEEDRAHVWKGTFPVGDPFQKIFTMPVGSFEPNGYGLFDMIGNVWEITSSLWTAKRPVSCCEPQDQFGTHIVKKGGSFACHGSYCDRYRPSARQSMEIKSSTNHIGFRVAYDLGD